MFTNYKEIIQNYIVREKTVLACIMGHLTHIHGDLTLKLETYKGYVLTPSEVEGGGAEEASLAGGGLKV